MLLCIEIPQTFFWELTSVFLGVILAYLLASFEEKRKKMRRVRQMLVLLKEELCENLATLERLDKFSTTLNDVVNKKEPTFVGFLKLTVFLNTSNPMMQLDIYKTLVPELVWLPKKKFLRLYQAYSAMLSWQKEMSQYKDIEFKGMQLKENMDPKLEAAERDATRHNILVDFFVLCQKQEVAQLRRELAKLVEEMDKF